MRMKTRVFQCEYIICNYANINFFRIACKSCTVINVSTLPRAAVLPPSHLQQNIRRGTHFFSFTSIRDTKKGTNFGTHALFRCIVDSSANYNPFLEIGVFSLGQIFFLCADHVSILEITDDEIKLALIATVHKLFDKRPKSLVRKEQNGRARRHDQHRTTALIKAFVS